MGSWEEAVRWYRAQPDNAGAIRDNYFDLPVRLAAERYASGEEFAEVLRLLGRGAARPLLDLGAGNGIASVALALSGWKVTALEPDPSSEVGAGAIRAVAAEMNLPITVMQMPGEKIPFPDSSFAAVHARQVLHHALELDAMVSEVYRVLRPGGLLLATREHVVDDDEQLAAFRASHPLHHLYGGESAYSCARYLEAFDRAGLQLKGMWGPLESVINFYPGTEAERQLMLHRVLNRSMGGAGFLLSRFERFRPGLLKRATERDRTPGRLFSFLLEKP